MLLFIHSQFLLLLFVFVYCCCCCHRHRADAADIAEHGGDNSDDNNNNNHKLTLPAFIDSNMVLQREPYESVLWGWGRTTPGKTAVSVTVLYGNKEKTSSLGEGPIAHVVADDEDDNNKEKGFWKVSLPPQPASVDRTIVIKLVEVNGASSSTTSDSDTGRNASAPTMTQATTLDSITLSNIAFGDVYFCSGQSNMEFAVGGAYNATYEIAASIYYPHLRLFTAQHVQADSPAAYDVPSKAAPTYNWASSTPQTVTDKKRTAFNYFSAVCYFFGRDLYQHTNGQIPIGLVASSWGGQRVETFSSEDALEDDTCGGTATTTTTTSSSSSVIQQQQQQYNQKHNNNNNKKRLRQVRSINNSTIIRTGKEKRALVMAVEQQQQQQQQQEGDNDHFSQSSVASRGIYPEELEFEEEGVRPTQIWNGMIHPFTMMRFKGAVWYQGEANSDNATNYACRFPAMIADWRKKFNLPNWHFTYVQLAPFLEWKGPIPELRASQDAALAIPNVSRVIALDIGDPASPYGWIHPRRKQEVGRRISLGVRKSLYNNGDGGGGIAAEGPILKWVRIIPAAETTATQSGTSTAAAETAILVFDTGFVDGPLHFAGAIGCSSCCYESPFQILDESGNWTRAPGPAPQPPVLSSTIELTPFPSSNNNNNQKKKILGIRLGWEAAPECILYSGMQDKGGPDDHQALPAPPFEWCAAYSGQPPWTGKGCVAPNSINTDTKVSS